MMDGILLIENILYVKRKYNSNCTLKFASNFFCCIAQPCFEEFPPKHFQMISSEHRLQTLQLFKRNSSLAILLFIIRRWRVLIFSKI